MIWEDVVIMFAAFGLALALIPSIISAQKPTRWSCVLTIILLFAMVVSFVSLGFWLSVGAEFLGIFTWGILLFQRRIKN